MLVITRKESEAILIGENIEIIITSIGTDKVKICIDAPLSIPIMRKELVEISNLNQEASIPPEQKSLQKIKDFAKIIVNQKKDGEKRS